MGTVTLPVLGSAGPGGHGRIPAPLCHLGTSKAPSSPTLGLGRTPTPQGDMRVRGGGLAEQEQHTGSDAPGCQGGNGPHSVAAAALGKCCVFDPKLVNYTDI